MELLKSSRKLELPKMFFISDRKQIKDIPIGIPFIVGDESTKPYIIRMLEYEVLYQRAIKSGYPFDFRKILHDAGFLDIRDFNFTFGIAPKIAFSSEGFEELEEVEAFDLKSLKEGSEGFKQYIRDSSTYVDLEVLKNLKVFPVWLDSIEKAVETNIQNFAMFNPNMYNKKLEGMYGGLELTSPGKNLIIIDISGSIPKAVSSTCLTLSKNLCESFYADILITGTTSILFPYEQIHELNIEKIYDIGMNNDQAGFKHLLTVEERHYKTAIVFGDDDHPGYKWGSGDKLIMDEDGQKLCKWKIDKLISLHTNPETKNLAGYARWFTPKETELIHNWVKYLNK